MISKLLQLYRKNTSHLSTAILFILYVAVFALYHDRFGVGVASLAVLPVISGSWYFGIRGGTLTAILSVLANVILLRAADHPEAASLTNTSNILRISILLLIAVAIGRLGSIIRERQEELLKLEENKKKSGAHTRFLELLNKATKEALEADNLDLTLKVLVEKIGGLFEADDCFFSFWDDAKELPIPIVAYGSMSDIFPFMQFETDETTVMSSVMKEERVLAVVDTGNSPYMDPQTALVFPSHSMLGIPIIVKELKLGIVLLGYNKGRSFEKNEIIHAEDVAEQVALVLSKAQQLEEERKKTKQLSALHDVALVSIQVDNEDELIERITDIIGNNLFPDNCGVLLLNEQNQVLKPHPSYRFFSDEKIQIKEVRLGEGITGQVAMTRQSQCIANVRRLKNYLDVDDRTASELCVPILFKDQLLGVINAESIKRNAFNDDDERLLATLAGQLATAIEQIRNAQVERKWLDRLAHSNNLIYSMAQITTQIDRALNTDEVIQTLGNELEKIGLTCIMAIHNNNDSFTINYTSLGSRFLKFVENGLGYPLIKYTFPRDRLAQISDAKDIPYPAVISNPEEEIRILFDNTKKQEILRVLQRIEVFPNVEPLRLPLVFEKNLLGILWVWGRDVQRTDLPIMSIFAKQVGISLERTRLFKEVQELASTDPLTKLMNRRSLFELGEIEFSRAIQMKRSFCCMMLDLDHFKQVNDKYGHMTGDQALREFARRCKNGIRETDLIGRYGGEELIILLPEIDFETAKQVAERLRKSIADSPMMVLNHKVEATVSIGIAHLDENTTDLETLVARADQALYIAKHKGRNRVATSI